MRGRAPGEIDRGSRNSRTRKRVCRSQRSGLHLPRMSWGAARSNSSSGKKS